MGSYTKACGCFVFTGDCGYSPPFTEPCTKHKKGKVRKMVLVRNKAELAKLIEKNPEMAETLREDMKRELREALADLKDTAASLMKDIKRLEKLNTDEAEAVRSLLRKV